MVPPGSPQVLRLPYDEGAPPNFAFYRCDQWSATRIRLMRQSRGPPLAAGPESLRADPKYWIDASASRRRPGATGPQGWSVGDEEIRLLIDVFNRNHAHRTTPRTRRGYIFLDKGFRGGWQAERTKMSAAVPVANITVHADTAAFAANQKASIANYVASFQQDYLVCQYVMHSELLNHYFQAESGQDVFPRAFRHLHEPGQRLVHLDPAPGAA